MAEETESEEEAESSESVMEDEEAQLGAWFGKEPMQVKKGPPSPQMTAQERCKQM